MAKITLENISYGGWQNCLRLTNGIVDLVATTDVGPRIIRFGFVGERNEFKEFPNEIGKTGGREWRAYGGHRLWYAPEHKTRTYYPDNFPIQYEWRDSGGPRSVASDAPTRSRRSVTPHGELRLIQPVEKTTGIQKEILLQLSPTKASVKVIHRLRNSGRRAIELAPWALSVMDAGGVAIIPLPLRGSHPNDLLPSSTLTLWPYTDLDDARWSLGRRFILLRQSADAIPKMKNCFLRETRYNQATPQKLGALVPDGWTAYANAGHLFVKKTKFIRNAIYPDFGCNFEIFTNHEMLEIESLGPLVNLKPRQSVEHIEEWSLLRDVPTPHDDAGVAQDILPKI